jgi:phosphoribosylamine--glycine ligase
MARAPSSVIGDSSDSGRRRRAWRREEAVRFLGIGDYCDLSSLYLRLQQEGHEVKVYTAVPECRGTLEGLVPKSDRWEEELRWVRAADGRGVILFENTADKRGALQDELRSDGYRVIGGCAFGDRLENDRAYAQELLKKLGFSVCPVYPFTDRQAALDFIEKRPARYVLKFNKGFLETFVGRMKDGRDVRAYLDGLSGNEEGCSNFVLMDFVSGIEMGVGAYFDGDKFLQPSCLDWEHKHFFPGDLGELTGEMGTIVTFDRTARFHAETLGRVEALLRDNGYCGYINLNTVVNEQGIWPLEFTCRFGYPGYAILDPLQEIAWADLFLGMIDQTLVSFRHLPGFAAGIVMTTPPFPYSRPFVDEPVGLPILFDEGLDERDRRHLHYGEVSMKNGQLVTSGANGWTMVITGTGASIKEAQERANALAARVVIPNVRYRRDIGEKLIGGEFERIEKLNLLDSLRKEM